MANATIARVATANAAIQTSRPSDADDVAVVCGAVVSNAPSSARRIAAMSGIRCFWSFWRLRRKKTSSVGETFPGTRLQSGSERTTAASVSVMSSPGNARLPVNISNNTVPNAQMSARLSTVLPRACSGDMYPGRAQDHPGLRRLQRQRRGHGQPGRHRACGLHRLREAEVEHLHRAVSANLDIRGLQIAMDDALLMRRFQRLSDLFCDGQSFINRDRAARDALREVITLDEFHHEGVHAPGLLEPVNRGDVRMVQGRERLRFALEPCQAFGRKRMRLGGFLIATWRPSVVSVARYTCPIPPSPMGAVISYTPRRVPGVRDKLLEYKG